ncbi:MAG: glucose-6-phosphate isomerase [Pleomorphochaeta sp.]
MKVTINSESNISVDNQRNKIIDIINSVDSLNSKYKESLGWWDLDQEANTQKLDEINDLAAKIRKIASVLVVIGIGGSNQGARAVIEALEKRDDFEVIWAGNNLSSYEAKNVIDSIGDRDFCINVIAKNFKTVEPGVGFRIFRDLLIKKYGETYNERVITTGTINSYFEVLSKKEGYTFIDFPNELGGRYSLFSNVGLLPIAFANYDIKALVEGAKNIASDIKYNEDVINYIAFRTANYSSNLNIEMLSYFEPRLFRFAKWWMQLDAESEGKDNKGIFPVTANFSEDLHSIGQFIQSGNPILFETFIKINKQSFDIPLLKNNVEDEFDYLNNKTLTEVNKISEMATIKAHSSRLPVCVIEVEKLEEFELGQLMYMYFYVTYISCVYMDVNPFDQPGVETYKAWMFEGLKK